MYKHKGVYIVPRKLTETAANCGISITFRACRERFALSRTKKTFPKLPEELHNTLREKAESKSEENVA